MSRVPKKAIPDLDPSWSAGRSNLPSRRETRTAGVRDPVDEVLRDQMHRASLPAVSDEAIFDDEIMQDAVDKDLIPVGLQIYFRLMETWGIGEEEAAVLLGFDHRPTEVEIGIELFKRISHTVGIYRALHTLLPHNSANTWVKRPNSAKLFGGEPALELLRRATPGFEAVRSHLAAAL